MQRAGKPSHTIKTPSVAPAAALSKPHTPSKSPKHGEDIDRGEVACDPTVNSFLETADVEKDGRDAEPDDATESTDIESADKQVARSGQNRQDPMTPDSGIPGFQARRVTPASTRRD